MPHIARIQSITNRPSGGGDKKAGLVNTSNWSRIPINILKSKTVTNLSFSVSGKMSMTQTTSLD